MLRIVVQDFEEREATKGLMLFWSSWDNEENITAWSGVLTPKKKKQKTNKKQVHIIHGY